MQAFILNFKLALQGILQNKLRSILTALGIIFGVAAVIAMLGIGTGAKQSIVDQLSLIGANSIVVNAKMPNQNGRGGEEESEDANPNIDPDALKGYTPGLSLADMDALRTIMPTTDKISPEIVQDMMMIYDKSIQRARCVGITNDFFDINNLAVGQGQYFHAKHFEYGSNVCIIGMSVATKLFKGTSPLGKQMKCGQTWFKVVGVLEPRRVQKSKIEELSIRDYNDDVFIPISSFLLRINNRKRIGEADVLQGRQDQNEVMQNYHQIDRAVIRITEPKYVEPSAELISRVLRRRHNDKIDFEIEVPELLLKQQQKTQETLNFVLAVIAGISLLVGGIGIMNIMLASVLERIKEIGIRRSLGAKRSDVILQFLFEAVAISLIGGLLGIALGVVSAKVVASYADIPTMITWWSIAISFVVAAGIGLIFGLLPAKRAANLDPITALRTE
ncbi:MAG: FtsX-like permease family protein [Saprospiraceae bacterium]|nr:FtsX-like permease family protein [Saprospiraceae bacterium]